MRILFTEPVSPRYMAINRDTNKLHLLLPVVCGQEISTDNTCKANQALKAFFDGGALRQLNVYKRALEFDIGLLETEHPQRVAKEERLTQIKVYIEAVTAMQQSYGTVLNTFLAKPSNLYSIQLRPCEQDPYSTVVNPVFNINRGNDADGTPLSALYNAMYKIFADVKIGVMDPKSRLIQAVLEAIVPPPFLIDIQRILHEKCQALFGIEVDFYHYFKRFEDKPEDKPQKIFITEESINSEMRFGEDTDLGEYIDALLYLCAENLWISVPTPPFYSVSNIEEDLSIEQERNAIAERTEHLSILTQFFLAHVNIYCQVKAISTLNFGVILDQSSALSEELSGIVVEALSSGGDVETCISHFFNAHSAEFELSRTLNSDDISSIQQKFARTYQIITATRENPHMDDFMILDQEATGTAAKFVAHQGSICVNFAEIVEPMLAHQDYFASIREDFANHPIDFYEKNDWIAGEVDIDIEQLMTTINDKQFAKLPKILQDGCRNSFAFQMREFLKYIVEGKLKETEDLLIVNPDRTQNLLRTIGIFTDRSGRTFNCSAYEYLYWAQNNHMCRMLKQHMDDETKALIQTRTAAIEASGLPYLQNGEERRSSHFDFTPLKEAYQRLSESHQSQFSAASRALDNAEYDAPQYIAQPYYRPYRHSFESVGFNSLIGWRLFFLPQDNEQMDTWFPLRRGNSSS